MLLASKPPPPPPPCLLRQRERRVQTAERTFYMLRAPFDAALSLSAVELSQPRSFSHARGQRAVLYLGAWPGAALARASEVTGDDVAWLIKLSVYKGESSQIGFTQTDRQTRDF